MALTAFTSYDEVRAVLGVSDVEIKDETLALAVYEDSLRMELDLVATGVYGKFSEVTAVAASSRTDDQKNFMRYMRLFCTYAVAKTLATSLPMFGPKSIGDGKANMSRFSDSPYKVTMQRIETEFGRMGSLLKVSYEQLASTSSVSSARVWFASTGNAIDPVTGS